MWAITPFIASKEKQTTGAGLFRNSQCRQETVQPEKTLFMRERGMSLHPKAVTTEELGVGALAGPQGGNTDAIALNCDTLY